jgi:hypothetical protein
LNRQLRMGTFAALDQRIAARFTIKPMDLAESAAPCDMISPSPEGTNLSSPTTPSCVFSASRMGPQSGDSSTSGR